jgi:hypothetical protein
MSIVFNASEVTLADLHDRLGLVRVQSEDFFPEWLGEGGELTDWDRLFLDRVRQNFLDQLSTRLMIEETVKLVVVSPLLDVAGFYRSPYGIESEVPVQVAMTVPEEGLLQGRIDTLVVRQRLWIAAVESKRMQLSIHCGVAQVLSYLVGMPEGQAVGFGMVTNGSEFLFVKVDRGVGLRYDLSNVFSLVNRGNDLYRVVGVLKRLG